jgi:Recombinase
LKSCLIPLGAAKARGVVLGKPENLTYEAQIKGAAVQREAAREAERKAAGYVQLLRESGVSLARIAARLNAEGHTTRNGKAFNPMQVSRMLERAV